MSESGTTKRTLTLTLIVATVLIISACAKKREAAPRAEFIANATLSSGLKADLESSYGLNCEAHCFKIVKKTDSDAILLEISKSDDCPDGSIANSPIAAMELMNNLDDDKELLEMSELLVGDSKLFERRTPVGRIFPGFELEDLCTHRRIGVFGEVLVNLTRNCKLKVEEGILQTIEYNPAFSIASIRTWSSNQHLKNAKDIERAIKAVEDRMDVMQTVMADMEGRLGVGHASADSLKSKVTVLDTNIARVTAEIAGLEAALTRVSDRSAAEKTRILALIADLDTKLDGIMVVANKTKTDIEAIVGGLDTKLDDVTTRANTTKTQIDGIISTLNTAIEKVKADAKAGDTEVNGLIATLNTAIEKVKADATAAQTSVNGIIATLNTAIQKVEADANAGKTSVDGIISALNTAIEKVKADAKAGDTEVKGIIKPLNALIEKAKSDAADGKTNVMGIINPLNTLIKKVKSDATDAETTVNGTIKTLNTAIQKVKDDATAGETEVQSVIDALNTALEAVEARAEAASSTPDEPSTEDSPAEEPAEESDSAEGPESTDTESDEG